MQALHCDTDIVIDESEVERIETPSAVIARSVDIVESNLGGGRAVKTGDTATTSCQLRQPVSGHNLVHFQGENQFFCCFRFPIIFSLTSPPLSRRPLPGHSIYNPHKRLGTWTL
jgi:hypothetical protein